MSHRLSQELPENEAERPNDLKPALAQQVAAVSLAGLVVRASGSGLAMISCGYVPESSGPARRCLEAKLRVQAVLDDESGQHARKWLAGRPMGTAERLAQRYGSADDLKLLSLFAHADVRGWRPSTRGLVVARGRSKKWTWTFGQAATTVRQRQCCTRSRTRHS